MMSGHRSIFGGCDASFGNRSPHVHAGDDKRNALMSEPVKMRTRLPQRPPILACGRRRGRAC
ncbi:hypothetical protein QO004_004382 [Rhizobium mesoamericanum]|nr:hypothetical protein [Rhizobium mesoamericanum]